CNSLTSINIPSNVTSIGKDAFYECTSIASITVAEKNPNYKSIGNCLLSKNGATLILGCKNSIIPNGVTSISNYAFYNCNFLTSITIPSGVTSIGNYAFQYCSSLTSIIIPSGVTSIGNYAFYGCSSLTSITIPDSVTEIREATFGHCSSLTSITFEGKVVQWNAITKSNYWNSSTGDYTIYCKNGTIKKS
ncbi:MAG: leucine-rich repeat domain-containing protein, partial [Clostridia bacterium]|nr:leucine-rich repeat domain-containing protein [Clostridia bacterium]